ncbi:MAG: Ger(x)C family spore germination protein [Bacillota bacterium]
MNYFGIIIRFSLVFALLLNLFLMTGCYDQREIDELAYPMAIGLDVGEANELRMTLQLAVPISIGGGSSGSRGGKGDGGGNETTTIITVDTPSIYSGLNLINNIISKEINVSHTKAIIMSKKFAEMGVSKYLHAFKRGREFKPDIFIVVSMDPPEEYLKETMLLLEVNPSKYYEQMLGKKFTSFFPNVRLHNFHQKLECDAVEPIAILTALSKYESVEQFKDSIPKNGNAFIDEGSYKAGHIPILSDRKNEVMGIAVFKEDKMCGILNGKESTCMQLVTGEFNHTYWTLPDPQVDNHIVVLNIFRRKRPVVKINMTGGKVKANIGIDLEGDFVSIQSGHEYESQPEIIEKKVEEMLEKSILELLEKTRDEFDSDICGIGNFVKKKFLTFDEWEKYNWRDQYKYTDFEVDVNFKIRRTGLIIKTGR